MSQKEKLNSYINRILIMCLYNVINYFNLWRESMKWNLKMLAMSFLSVMLIAGVGLTGCSSSAGNSSSSPQSSTAQQPSGQSGRQPSGTRNSQNSQNMINKAAITLGVSAEDLGNAYRDALSSVFAGRESSGGGQPPQQGQPSTDGQAQGQRRTPPDMTPVYQKIAATLKLSVDDVSKAFDQARQESQTQTQ
jgi:hypothetical protein